jgi:hypothetical protein
MGSALNPSPYGDDLAYCSPVVEFDESDLRSLSLTFRYERLHPTESPCWLPLFCGACIASDFPISGRQDNMGLEIPVEIMAQLIGARSAMEYENGVVIKGFSRMFIPVKRSGDRIQWHLVSSPDEDTRLTYQDGISRCDSRASLAEVDLACLHTTRAIVGWCEHVGSHLGSETVDYNLIDYSRSEEAGRSLRLDGAAFGFQQFGAGQLNVSLGAKDGKCHFQRSGPYRRIISAADRTPIVLFDTMDRRGWLVLASEVMLHIAQHRNMLDPFEVAGEEVQLPSTKLEGPRAKEVLLKSASLDLSDDFDEEYKFKNMILDIWLLLENLLDQQVSREQAPGKAVPTTFRETIEGYEFKAVVEERSPFQRKKQVIASSGGGWPDLVHDIGALVLLANGYGEVLEPIMADEKNQGLCHFWKSVPKHQDFLATRIKSIMELYEVAGCRLDRTYLTSTRLQWHRGDSSLFEPCPTPDQRPCQCNRLQRIISKSPFRTIVSPGELADEGGVIFGKPESHFKQLTNLRRSTSNGVFYPQKHAPIRIPEDNGRQFSGTPALPIKTRSNGPHRATVAGASF